MYRQKGKTSMFKTNSNYMIIREYKGLYEIDELVKRLIRYHISIDFMFKEGSNHEVTYDK